MNDLETYLRELYPEAGDELIDYYLQVIKDHEEDKLPPTKEMQELVELDKKAKEIDRKVKLLKSKILEQRKNLNCKFQLVNISHITGKKYSPARFYDWVSTLVDNKTLEDLTIKTIDENKFIKLEAKGVIQYDYIPKECYENTEQWRISVSKAKDKLDNDLDENGP